MENLIDKMGKGYYEATHRGLAEADEHLRHEAAERNGKRILWLADRLFEARKAGDISLVIQIAKEIAKYK